MNQPQTGTPLRLNRSHCRQETADARPRRHPAAAAPSDAQEAMKELTNEEARAVFAQFAGQQAPLTYYYKFNFSFGLETETARINLSYGACSEDIYRFELTGPFVKVPASIEEAIEAEGYSVWLTDKSNNAEAVFRPTY